MGKPYGSVLGLLSLSTAPASPVTGETYYDSTRKQVRTWTGTAWVSAQELLVLG